MIHCFRPEVDFFLLQSLCDLYLGLSVSCNKNIFLRIFIQGENLKKKEKTLDIVITKKRQSFSYLQDFYVILSFVANLSHVTNEKDNIYDVTEISR